MIILQTLAFVYFGVACLMALVLAVAVIKVGGFKEFADRMNMLAGDTKMYTSNRIQWLVVIAVVFWFLLPLGAMLDRG